MRLWWVLVVPLLGVCLAEVFGLDRTIKACDLREAGLEPRNYCNEWRGLVDSVGSDVGPVAICEGLQADLIDGPCPEGIVAGCFIGTLGDGSEAYWWYYSSDAEPMTATVRIIDRIASTSTATQPRPSRALEKVR